MKQQDILQTFWAITVLCLGLVAIIFTISGQTEWAMASTIALCAASLYGFFRGYLG